MTILEIMLTIFFGTLWGSFFYTLSLRYISGMFSMSPLKALFSSSKCPACGERINPFYLVPIIGYMIQGGKCKRCEQKISYTYPLFEITYGLLLYVIVSKYGISIYSFNMFLLSGIAISISIIDVKTLTIPNSLILTFLILSIYPIVLSNSYKDSFYGLALMSLVFITILLQNPVLLRMITLSVDKV